MLAILRRTGAVRLALFASLLGWLGLAVLPCCDALVESTTTETTAHEHGPSGLTQQSLTVEVAADHQHGVDDGAQDLCCDAVQVDALFPSMPAKTTAAEPGHPVLAFLPPAPLSVSAPTGAVVLASSAFPDRHRFLPPRYLFTQRFLI